MAEQDDLTIVAQMPDHKDLQPGIHENADQVIGLEPDLGLIAISTSPLGTESSPARVAMGILMDDMQTNIPQIKSQMADNGRASLGADCLQESLENINEYLYDQTASRFDTTQSTITNITALQYLNGHLSFVIASGEKCLLFRNNKLKSISDTVSRPLGGKPNYNSKVLYEAMSLGDILFIAAIDDINTLETDFIRLTLSRFPENLDMVLRQLNTKISRTGARQIPSVVVCRINQETSLKRGWIGKLRSR